MNRINLLNVCFLLVLFFGNSITINAQEEDDIVTGEDEQRIVQTAVPFLNIAPDSRASSMGDIGTATTPDVNSLFWNPAKYAFIEKQHGLSLSYVPWLKNLVNDINLLNLSGFIRLDKRQTVGASLYYFKLGEIEWRDEYNAYKGTINPNEFSVDVSYSRQFSNNFSGGIAFRYIRSDLSQGRSNTGEPTSAGNAVAADIAFYNQKEVNLGDKDGIWRLGVNIANLGNKISYSSEQEYFIPTNLRFGNSLEITLDEYNSLTFGLDLQKLMVPSPALYSDSTNEEGENIRVAGLGDENDPLPVAMVKSFYDAPGIIQNDGERSVLKEELREIKGGLGVEYWYAGQFAIRGGYYYEDELKGNRKYFSMGIGLKLNVFSLDVSYLIPKGPTSPLANTIRFSLAFNFNNAQNQNQNN